MLRANSNPFEFLLRGYALLPEDRNPTAEVQATEDSYLLTLEIPGYRVDDIEVVYDCEVLTVSGDRIRNGLEQSFERSFTFKDLNVDVEEIQACLEDGILTLTVPKIERTSAKKIEIQIVNPSSE